MIKQTIATILFCVSQGFACEIALHERYVKQFTKSPMPKVPFKNSTCSVEIENLVSAKILELSGVVPSSYIANSLDLPLKISPDKVEIVAVDYLIEKKLTQEGIHNQKVLNYHSSYPAVALGIDKLDLVEITCNECLNASAKIFQFSIQSATESPRKFKVHANMGHKITALKSSAALKPDNSPISLQSFEAHETFVLNPEDYVSDSSILPYHKINTTLKPGALLLKKHLSKIFLAQSGREVEIFLNHDGFMLQTKGTALQNGAIDEFIKVKNLDSKKTLQAKVVGENKVRIDL